MYLWSEFLTHLVIDALRRDFEVLDPLEEVEARLHGLVAQLVLLVLQNGYGYTVQEGLSVDQVPVPDSQAILYTLEALDIQEQGGEPPKQVEIVPQVDCFELFLQGRKGVFKELVEEVHSPLDSILIIIHQDLQKVAL